MFTKKQKVFFIVSAIVIIILSTQTDPCADFTGKAQQQCMEGTL